MTPALRTNELSPPERCLNCQRACHSIGFAARLPNIQLACVRRGFPRLTAVAESKDSLRNLGAMPKASETTIETRFEFGENWHSFLRNLDDSRIQEAERSLQEMLETSDLRGKTFLDVGSGSGLFSLAARRLGASVYSFDFDPKAVNCGFELKRQYRPSDPDWIITEGSALDKSYLNTLGQYDIVYSWGVLLHRQHVGGLGQCRRTGFSGWPIVHRHLQRPGLAQPPLAENQVAFQPLPSPASLRDRHSGDCVATLAAVAERPFTRPALRNL